MIIAKNNMAVTKTQLQKTGRRMEKLLISPSTLNLMHSLRMHSCSSNPPLSRSSNKHVSTHDLEGECFATRKKSVQLHHNVLPISKPPIDILANSTPKVYSKKIQGLSTSKRASMDFMTDTDHALTPASAKSPFMGVTDVVVEN